MATPRIVRAGPIPRQEGLAVPDLLVPSQWIDAVSLAAGVAENYALPVDASGQRGTILRLASVATTIFYLKWDGTAAAPVGDIVDGTSSTGYRLDVGPAFIVAPDSAFALSLFNGSASIVTIEVWN